MFEKIKEFNKMSLENHQTVHDGDFTSKSVTKLKDSDILLQNQRRDFSTNSFKNQANLKEK